MDLSFLTDIIDQLTVWMNAANEVPGSIAFVLGAIAWFLVEQIIRRIASIMRTVLIIGLVAASGVSAIALINFFTKEGDTSGFETTVQQQL